MPGQAGEAVGSLPGPFAYLLTVHLKEGRNLVIRDRCGKEPCVSAVCKSLPLISTTPGADLQLATWHRVQMFLSTSLCQLEAVVTATSTHGRYSCHRLSGNPMAMICDILSGSVSFYTFVGVP